LYYCYIDVIEQLQFHETPALICLTHREESWDASHCDGVVTDSIGMCIDTVYEYVVYGEPFEIVNRNKGKRHPSFIG